MLAGGLLVNAIEMQPVALIALVQPAVCCSGVFITKVRASVEAKHVWQYQPTP